MIVTAPPLGVEVAMIFPLLSVARKVFMIPVRIVELLNVAVALKIVPLVNVWRPVQMTEEAAVTNPGFVKLFTAVHVDDPLLKTNKLLFVVS